METPRHRITRLLVAWRSGDAAAEGVLMSVLYEDLRRIARSLLRSDHPAHTLQPTALVHEAYQRLLPAGVSVEDRNHFLSVAARAMRRVLVDHARSRGRLKRGGGVRVAVPEGASEPAAEETSLDLVALDEALEQLRAVDARRARMVELHYFGGLNYDEIATAVEVSPATVGRDLRFARAWLRKVME